MVVGHGVTSTPKALASLLNQYTQTSQSTHFCEAADFRLRLNWG